MARKMKDSGVEWIGEIPEDWEIVRGKYILKQLKKPVMYDDEVITCFRDGEVTLRSNRREDGFTMADKEIGYQGIDIGDLVIHGMDGFAGAIGISDSRGKGSPVLNVLDSTENKKFIMYYLLNMAYGEVFSALATGIRVRSVDIRWNKLANLPYPMPSNEEQIKIICALEDNLNKTDKIIKIINGEIQTLEDYKKSIITEAVTKGLDKNVEMKDSGIEWIGEIPKHWKINKVGRICNVITDFVASGSFASLAKNVKYFDDENYAMLVRTVDLSNKRGNVGCVYVDKSSYNFLNNSNLFGGEIILPNIGASIGDVYIVPKLFNKMTLGPNSVMIKTNYVDKYYYYCFVSKIGRVILENLSISSAQAKFNKTQLKEVRLMQPSTHEQEKIATYLDKKCTLVDSAILKKQKQLETLEEYKKSLIYEYVTGKKEVLSC